MGQLQLTISLVMIGLFSVAVIGFAINFATDNNAPVDISDDTDISNLYTRSSSNLSGFASDSEGQYQSILETTIAPESGSAQSTAPFAITPANALSVVKNVMEVGYTKIFGSKSGFNIFFTSLIAVIVFAFGFFIYKTLRGMPD